MQNEIRTLTSTDLRSSSTTQQDQLGATGYTEDNRQFSYVGVGASAVTPGQLLVTPAVVTAHQGLSLATSSQRVVGATQIQVTLGATGATQNQYADGFFDVITGTGAGISYRIRGNAAASANGVLTLDLVNTEPLVLALGTTTTINLKANPFMNVVSSTTPSHAVGVATAPIPANGYGWVQNYGICATLIQGSISKGNAVMQSTSVAGAVASLSGSSALLGNTLEACTDTQYNGVWLQIT